MCSHHELFVEYELVDGQEGNLGGRNQRGSLGREWLGNGRGH